MERVNVGDKVKDKVTGIVGIVISRTEYLYGCARVAVQQSPKEPHERPVDCIGLDEPQCEILERGTVKSMEQELAERQQPLRARTGGPGVETPRRGDTPGR